MHVRNGVTGVCGGGGLRGGGGSCCGSCCGLVAVVCTGSDEDVTDGVGIKQLRGE